MKKFAVMLFSGAAFLMLGAAEIDVNGVFKTSKAGAALPDGWFLNGGPKPVGKHEVIRKDGRNFVRIVSEKSMYGLVAPIVGIAVKPGEKYRLTVTAEGKGTVNVGIFLYHGTAKRNKYLVGNYANPVKLSGIKTVTRDIVIADTVKGSVPNIMRATFYAMSPADVTFSNFKLEKLD